MPKTFWKGVISFGMVVIPVKMYVDTEAKSFSFHLLHKKCLTRPKPVLHCEQDAEYFSIKDTVRGYEYAKEQYMVLDDNYRAALKEVVEAKMKGITLKTPEEPKAEVENLMEALKASLAEARQKSKTRQTAAAK